MPPKRVEPARTMRSAASGADSTVRRTKAVEHASPPPRAGWLGFDFVRAFDKPVHVLHDAALQALGCYRDGTMLFLGLGTGLGTALVKDSLIVPMELAHLPYRKGESYEHYLGQRGFLRLGRKRWQKHVLHGAGILQRALEAEELVLGGGNARHLRALPEGVRRVDRSYAFIGGFRLRQRLPAAGEVLP